ncbi:MAG: hypothetical protein U9P14_12820 [Gemmatimonadota bacterium]|nr:hypothetical protein [Gemmatimonadota bacterium]
MSVLYQKSVQVAVLSLVLILAACTSDRGEKDSVDLLISDKVVGKTMIWLGPSIITKGPSEEITAKYIRDSGFNTTKYWHYTRNYPQLAARRELYGPRTKEIAIRQVLEQPEKIDWDFELEIHQDKSANEHRLDLCKKYGIQPVINFLATTDDPKAAPGKKTLWGQLFWTDPDDQLGRDVFWRRVFLYCYWANKIKNYNFTLWEVGCENYPEASAMMAEVGSDAIREAEKLTGVKVKIAAAGEDYSISDIGVTFEKILLGKAADRLDALSYHSFNFYSKFPEESGFPTYLEHLRYFNFVQRWCRSDNNLLPYWDTSWAWRTGHRTFGLYQSDHLLAGLQYTSRLIWSNQGGVELSAPFIMYGPESDSLYGGNLSGFIKVKEGTEETRPSKSYYAMRMIARATVGGKQRLELEGLPAGDKVLALASRDKENLYLTVINRTKDTAHKFPINKPAGLSDGRPYFLREFSEKVNDEVVGEGKLPLELELEPLSVKQLIVPLQNGR